MKFIYVFDVAAKEQLISKGYLLLKENAAQSIYVFKDDNSLKFELSNNNFVYSDTLTF